MTVGIPIPEFDDEEDKQKYLTLVNNLRQEFLNSLLTFLFLSSVIKIIGNDIVAIERFINHTITRFREQIVAMHQGKIYDPEHSPFSYGDPEDVKNILGQIINSSGVTETGDEIFDLALDNVCNVYEDVLKEAFRDMIEKTT